MLKKGILIIILLMLLSLTIKPKNSNDNSLVVSLIHKTFDEEFFIDDDYYYTTLVMKSFNYYPKYSQYLKDNYRGIPQNDSVSYYSCIEDRFLRPELYKYGDLTKEEEDWYLSHKDIDTLNNSKVKLKSTIIAVIGFYKNKQFMIADANRNKDFSDDIKFEYDINFRNNPYDNIEFLNKQPVAEYTYQDAYKGTIETYNRRFIIYPDKNNPLSMSNLINPKKVRESFSVLKFRDYWKGETTVDNKKIEFIYHGYSNHYGMLYVKPKEVPYKASASFDSQYLYKYYGNDKVDDTISINNNKYMIDSISRDISKLYLRKVGEKKHYGYDVGNYISNININDLEDNSFNINKIIKQKKYTLIEFWGTWCGPCIEMTPRLKEIHKKYEQNLTMISIAVDNDKKDVENYIKKNKINWKIGYISKNKSWENPVIKQLNVEYFPTFILIDSNGKIISRDDPDEMIKKIK